ASRDAGRPTESRPSGKRRKQADVNAERASGEPGVRVEGRRAGAGREVSEGGRARSRQRASIEVDGEVIRTARACPVNVREDTSSRVVLKPERPWRVSAGREMFSAE